MCVHNRERPLCHSSGIQNCDVAFILGKFVHPCSKIHSSYNHLISGKLYLATLWPWRCHISQLLLLLFEQTPSFCFTHRTDFIITGSCDGHIKFWKKLEELIEFVKHFRSHLGAVQDLAANSSGTFLCSVSSDKSLKVFDVVNFGRSLHANSPLLLKSKYCKEILPVCKFASLKIVHCCLN